MRTMDVIGCSVLVLIFTVFIWASLSIDAQNDALDCIVVGKDYVPSRTYEEQYRPTPRQIVTQTVTDPEEWQVRLRVIYDGDIIERRVSEQKYESLEIGDTLKLGSLR